MGTWTMSAPGGGGSSGGGMQQPPAQILGRQGSSFSLNINEVQNHLGEPLRSMNLDEFVKNIFPVDANQDQGMGMVGYSTYASASESGIQRQTSLNMRQFLSKKTVDEVWREIQQGRKKGLCSEDRRLGHERQPTLGEMTLEDFLMNVGMAVEDSSAKHEENVGFVGITGPMAEVHDFAQGAQWLLPYHQMPTTDQHEQAQRNVLESYMAVRPVQQPLAVGTGPMGESVYHDSQINVSSPTLGSPSDSNMIGRKRAFSGDMASKLVERRQKRMIKNRESAARSRARKQAYTNELESKVSRLEEDNKRLKTEKGSPVHKTSPHSEGPRTDPTIRVNVGKPYPTFLQGAASRTRTHDLKVTGQNINRNLTRYYILSIFQNHNIGFGERAQLASSHVIV